MNFNLACLFVFLVTISGIPYLGALENTESCSLKSQPTIEPIQATIIYGLGALLFAKSACHLLSATLPCTVLGLGVGTMTIVGHVRTVWDEDAWLQMKRLRDGGNRFAKNCIVEPILGFIPRSK
jgi:hypothetical protein